MSDEEFYSEESYEFEFEEDEDGDEAEEIELDESRAKEDEDDGIEQKYYSAKALKFDDSQAALKAFAALIDEYSQEADVTTFEWVFKSYKQVIKVNFNSSKYKEALVSLQQLLDVLPRVSSSYGSESLSRIINNYSLCNDQEFVQSLYETILVFLNNSTSASGANYDRLWIKISLNKLASSLESGDREQCSRLMDSINKKFGQVSKQIKKSYSLDLIALEIQYYSEQHEAPTISKLNELYRKSLESTTTVTHPKILGIIRECGAKIQFYRGNYEKARLEFYESFNNYDEAGSSLKKKVLKYLILCSLLTENQFNPFESQETSTYASLPEFSNLILLIKAYDSSDVAKFAETIVKINQEDDPMVRDDVINLAIDQVSRNLVKKSILNLLKAYKTLRFEYVRNKFNISQDYLESILIKLMTAGKLEKVKIDFVNQVILSRETSEPIFPPNLSVQDIHINMKLNEKLGSNDASASAEDDRMEVDQPGTMQEHSIPGESENLFNRQYVERGDEFRSGVGDTISNDKDDLNAFSKVLFITEHPSREQDWFKIIADWFKALQTSIPEPVRSEMSQKDQVEFRQRNENAISNIPTKIKKDEAESVPGLVNPIGHPDDAEGDDNEYNVQMHKVDVLSNWKKELDQYYRKLGSIG